MLQRRAGVALASMDCYVSTVGGVRLTEPATDLAVCMALASAAQDRPPERLGFAGRREGIAAIATAALMKA